MVSSSATNLRLLCANDVYKPERMSKMIGLREKYTSKDGTTKCVFPGDFLGGSFFASSFKGESMIDVFNTIGFDYVTLGNHEFDYGSEQTAKLMDTSSFSWLGSNVRDAKTGGIFHTTIDTDVFEISTTSATDSVGECHPFRIGVFGLCTENTPVLSKPGNAVVFSPPLTHAQRCVSKLRDELECDVVIALTHLAIGTDKVLAESIPGIDVIIGGHDHEPVLITHHDVLIVKCGQNFDYLGVLDLDIERAPSGNIVVVPSFQLVATNRAPCAPVVDAVIERWQALRAIENAEAENDKLVSIVGTEVLSTRSSEVRSKEARFPCLLADALAWSYRKRGYTCDFCIQNGGFCRGDAQYKPGTMLTRANILEELPFPQPPALLRMRGEDVMLGLEQMLPQDTPAHGKGSFPHLSEGIKATYDLSCSSMERLQSVYVPRHPINATQKPSVDNNADGHFIGTNIDDRSDKNVTGAVQETVSDLDDTSEWVPMDPNAEYLVAISEFYPTIGGDGVEVYTRMPVVARHGQLAKDVMVEYLKSGIIDSVSGAAPGRMVSVRNS